MDGDARLCSTCVALCRTYGCKKKLADGDDTRCSNCLLTQKQQRIFYYLLQGTSVGYSAGGCQYCKKHHGKRDTQCARCNIKGLEEGGDKIFCLDCKKKFRKEMEEAFSLSLS